MVYLEKAKQAALEAWNKVMRIYNSEYEINSKNDNSPVTEADITSNEILYSHLKDTWIPILSEETKDNQDRLNSDYLWIIDPLDGTKDFINQTGEFSIMIGLVYQGNPILGVINQPAANKLYFAQESNGSFLMQDDEIFKITTDPEQKSILTSRNHTSNEEYQLIKELNLTNHPCGSVGVKLGLIAEWKAGNYINLSNKLGQWDICWPHLILEQAGGKITNVYWDSLSYNQESTKMQNWVIATNWTYHNQILEKTNHY